MNKINYKSVPIKRIGKVVTGKTPATAHKEFYDGQYMFISPTELHGGYFVKKSEKTLTEAGLKSVKSNSIDGTSILVGCIGWDMGNVAMCNEKCATNQQINSITEIKEEYNPYYVYYWLCGKKEYLFSIASVTRTPILSKSVFEEVLVPLPEKKQQDNVVNILLRIDKKIALNEQINDNLAYQLKDIYNYWFNQFDFPHNDKHQYKADGGLMIWNDKIKCKIPAGWEIKSFGELCSLRNGINYDKSVEGDKMYRIINVRNISSSDLILNENDLDEISLPQKQGNKYCVSENSIIVARSGIPGATRILQKPSSNIIFCGFIICCTPCDDIYKYYLMFYLKQLEGSAATKTGGSILQNVSQDTLSNLPVPIPPQSLLREFNQIVSQSLELIHSNMQENTQLLKLRDWLLPMLMNGQATISD
nr:restriction endonuclease subunit S [uncultured Lachnoanaerobaculum sp.]